MKASGRYSPSLMATVQEVLAKLLMVGVTDSGKIYKIFKIIILFQNLDNLTNILPYIYFLSHK